jgi:GT2 family glycosyltransferase
MIAISIVSHGHGAMVQTLVKSLMNFSEVAQIIVTLNIPESLVFPDDVRVKILLNKHPKGFAENHNSAFQYCQEEFFCPLNPDVEFILNPFPILLMAMNDFQVGLVAPRIDSPEGFLEDSFRRFPTFSSLFLKLFGGEGGSYMLSPNSQPFSPDWVAGMFMLFRSQVFHQLRGFDESFFLYYEDVDIGVRLWKNGYRILACPNVTVYHDARRDSHRKWRHFGWHLSSMTRYFIKYWGRLPCRSKDSH